MLNRSKDPINLYSELARAHDTVLFTGLDAQLGRMEIRKVWRHRPVAVGVCAHRF